MKNCILFFWLIVPALFFCCSPSTTQQQESISSEQKDTSDLILELQVQPYDMAVAYGNVYNCRVNKTVKGFVEDSLISIVILGTENAKDSVFYNVSVAKNKLEIGFKKHRKNEPYRMMPIDGFVDADNTSWKIVYIDKLSR